MGKQEGNLDAGSGGRGSIVEMTDASPARGIGTWLPNLSGRSLAVRTVVLIVTFAGLTSLFAGAQSSDSAAVTSVLALEHAWNQAEERKDAKALAAIFDNALVYIDDDGSIRNKAEFLSHIRAASLHPEQEITESMTAHQFGTTIVVAGVYILKGTEHGKAYLRRGRFIDTWILEDRKWLCVASQSTPIPH
jgi:ketosteroid isomerase-like protein